MNGAEVTEASGISESFELAVRNLYLVAIEFPENEPIEPLIVGAAVVPQEPEGLLLADEETTDAVGTVVNAGGIAAPSAMRHGGLWGAFFFASTFNGNR